MWNRYDEVPKDAADNILERWDQTTPALQRMIVLQGFLDKTRVQDFLTKHKAIINYNAHMIAECECDPDSNWQCEACAEKAMYLDLKRLLDDCLPST